MESSASEKSEKNINESESEKSYNNTKVETNLPRKWNTWLFWFKKVTTNRVIGKLLPIDVKA